MANSNSCGKTPTKSTPLPKSESAIKTATNADAETKSEAQTVLPSAVPTPEIPKVIETLNPEPEVSKSQEVIIEALDRVTIEYSIDDKPRATIVLSPEKVHTFKGEKKVSLSFSDGGSINLIHNGKDKGVPGNLGKPLKISFPE